MRLEQTAMMHNPSQFAPALFRGKISRVIHADSNTTLQTLVDLYMYDLLPLLYAVPVMASKINASNGEQQTPEAGDVVLVGFIGGKSSDPVVLGYLPTASNPLQATAEEAPHFRRRQNGTSETIKKDGSRETYIAKDETLTVKGAGTVTIQEGDLSVTVSLGKMNVAVFGDVTLHTSGNLEATADGTATIQATGAATVQGSEINIIGDGQVHVAGNGGVTVDNSTSGTIAIQSAGAVTVSGTGNVNVTSTGPVAINAQSSITFTTPNTGTVTIE